MSQEKAQLIAPIDSSFTVPGVTVSGVVTATSFDGTITGVADSITQGKNLNVGVITALSFSGNLTGDAGGLIGSPNTVAGVVTANSFVGGITGNITGDVIGNASGIGASIKQGNNLNVGIATAVEWYGDGSGVTGAGSSAYAAQEITATGDETIIDLSYGNVIYYKGQVDTTVGFASTSPAENLTFIRDTSSTFDVAYNESFSTGGVTFDGTGDYLSISNNAAFQLGTGDFTVEFFYKGDDASTYNQVVGTQSVFDPTDGLWRIGTYTNSDEIYITRGTGSGFETCEYTVNVNDDAWHHIAFTRADGNIKTFVDGVRQTPANDGYSTESIPGSMTSSNDLRIARNDRDNNEIDAIISNVRIVKGTAVYTENFLPPSTELPNITNTTLLCCRSDSSTTVSAVSAGTITASGDPAAAMHNITYSGTNALTNSTSITWPDRVKWNNDITPTLFTNPRTSASAMQVFRFTTVDTGLTYNAWEEMKTDNDSFDLFNWGTNSNGVLGDNSTASKSSPIQVSSTIPWWSKIANYGNGQQPSSSPYAMAIKSDATLWAWGYNRLGSGGWNSGTDSASRSSPTQIPGEWSTSARCYTGSLGVKTDGTLWAWGTNNQGGNGTNNRTSYSSPTQIGTDTTWAKDTFSVARAEGSSSPSDSISAAIKTDGKLWMWGDNAQGALGKDDTTDRSSPTQVPGSAYSTIKLERHTVAALTTPGGLKTWGLNDEGQLGLNNRNSKSEPQNVPGSWAEIDTGTQLMVAIKTDGTLWAWGTGGFGALGQNQGGSFGANCRSSPTQIGTDTTWSKCSAGHVSGMASKTDGTLWVWGYQALGQNTPGGEGLSSPTQIPGTNWVGQQGKHGAVGSVLRGRNYPS